MYQTLFLALFLPVPIKNDERKIFRISTDNGFQPGTYPWRIKQSISVKEDRQSTGVINRSYTNNECDKGENRKTIIRDVKSSFWNIKVKNYNKNYEQRIKNKLDASKIVK
jgi:hypothetical protein